MALYLRIMAEYAVRYISPGSEQAVSVLACASAAAIVLVGATRGFRGLDITERLALIAVLVLTTALGATFVGADVSRIVGGGIDLPPAGRNGLGETLLLLGGLVITVQGFETVRYLAEEYDAPTRIWASPVAQAVSASIYVGFVAVATPLMGAGTAAGADNTLVDITDRVAPLLTLPLVLCAVLSQLSAATADTAAAAGNLHEQAPKVFGGRRAYLLTGAAGAAMIWTIPTLTIVVIASRAFAAYYCVQCIVAMRTSPAAARRVGYGGLALMMAAVALLAEPVGWRRRSSGHRAPGP